MRSRSVNRVSVLFVRVALPVGLSSSCRNRCETDVARWDAIRAKASATTENVSRIRGNGYFFIGIFISLIGGIFLLLTLTDFVKGKYGELYDLLQPLAFGLIFIAWGISSFILAKKTRQK